MGAPCKSPQKSKRDALFSAGEFRFKARRSLGDEGAFTFHAMEKGTTAKELFHQNMGDDHVALP